MRYNNVVVDGESLSKYPKWIFNKYRNDNGKALSEDEFNEFLLSNQTSVHIKKKSNPIMELCERSLN
jgi:hypothetical protein